MKTFITQPTYLPWIGIFKAIDYCDNFVFYNDVQFEKKSWQNRNKILNKSNGKFLHLTIPTNKTKQKTLINKIKINNPLFYLEHLKKIMANHKQTIYRKNLLNLLQQVYSQKYQLLTEINTRLIIKLSEYIGIKTNFLYSDKFNITGDKYGRPLKIAKTLNTTEYLTQNGTKEYTNIQEYKNNNIEIIFLNFEHPVYTQEFHNFTPYLSIIDILINIGPQRTKEMIQKIKFEPL